MRNEKILNIVDNFKNRKIGVISDLMLDQFIWEDIENFFKLLFFKKKIERK